MSDQMRVRDADSRRVVPTGWNVAARDVPAV
jgi:hypothetical protein